MEETIVPGPFGRDTVVVTVEDDVHIDEEIKKSEKVGHHNLHAKSSSPPEPDQGTSTSIVQVAATPPSAPHHHDDLHHQLENKP